MNNPVRYKFMESTKQWVFLKPEEKQVRLMDIQVIFSEAKDLIKEEMIRNGFKPGSKIIDISYFTGLSEFGFTIASFLVQHESGGEIRELSLRIDLEQMKVSAQRNAFYSSGKERYHYLKRNKLEK